MKRTARAVPLVLVSAAALTAIAVVALGARTQTPPTAQAQSSPATAGMRAVVIPETGLVGDPGTSQLPPLTEEEKALVRSPETVQLHQQVMPDGSVMVDLQGTGQEFMIMSVDANGKKSMKCVENPDLSKATPSTTERGDR